MKGFVRNIQGFSAVELLMVGGLTAALLSAVGTVLIGAQRVTQNAMVQFSGAEMGTFAQIVAGSSGCDASFPPTFVYAPGVTRHSFPGNTLVFQDPSMLNPVLTLVKGDRFRGAQRIRDVYLEGPAIPNPGPALNDRILADIVIEIDAGSGSMKKIKVPVILHFGSGLTVSRCVGRALQPGGQFNVSANCARFAGAEPDPGGGCHMRKEICRIMGVPNGSVAGTFGTITCPMDSASPPGIPWRRNNVFNRLAACPAAADQGTRGWNNPSLSGGPICRGTCYQN